MSDDTIPLDDAQRSVKWALDQTARVLGERDRYRTLWEAADGALRTYVAEVLPLLARKPNEAANAARSRTSAERTARARAYRALGHTYAWIGLRMAREDGRADHPYSRETVRRWLLRAE